MSTVVGHSAASGAGFKNGDRIVTVDGQPTPNWTTLTKAIQSRAEQPTSFTVVRDGQPVSLEATPTRQNGKGFLGVGPGTAYRSVGILGAVPQTFRSMGDIATGTAGAFGHLFSPAGVSSYAKNFTSSSSSTASSGSAAAQDRPVSIIGIVTQGSSIVNGNLWALLWLLGAISLILALFNLLPVLPFDGGHAVVVVYEWVASKIRGREVRVDFRKLMPVTAVVLVLILTLSLSAVFLDVRQAFGG